MSDIERAEDAVRRGDADLARRLCEPLLQRHPRDARVWAAFVNAANLADDADAAIRGLQQLLALHPSHPTFTRMLATAHNNRGSRLHRSGALADAIDAFRVAVAVQPAHPSAWFNLAVGLQANGDRPAAIDAFRRHLALQPDDARARLLLAELDGTAGVLVDGLDQAAASRFDPGLLARIAAAAGRGAAAGDALQRVRASDDVPAAFDAIRRLHLDGEADIARPAADRLRAAIASPLPCRIDLIRHLSLPAIHADADSVARARAGFADGLRRLEQEWPARRFVPGTMPLQDLAHGNFLLAYQGGDDLPLQRRFATLVGAAARALQPQHADRPAGGARNRIGLLSSFWYDSTVGSYFGSWIDWLRAAGFEVFVYQLGPAKDAATAGFAARASVFRALDGPLEHVAQTVRDDALDLLVYPELGMDGRLLPLAGLRLARRQAVAWGHPVTSGFETIDDYLTCGPMEPVDGAAHYVERCVPLPGLGVDFRRPPIPARVDPAALGLDPARPRVLVPQSLFKLHPDGDAVLVAIASRLPRVQFVFFEASRPAWRPRFEARLRGRFAEAGLDVSRHLAWQPTGSREHYLRVVQACDLMLDSLHWSGGNTTLDSLLCGVPVVACPGAFMRGRQSHAMLERIGLAEALGTRTPAQQADRVVALLDAPDALGALSAHIRTHLPQLLDARDARAALVAWARAAMDAPPP